MSIAGIFLLIAFLASVIIIVIWPHLQAQPKHKTSDTDTSPLSALARLQAEHEAVLLAIRDLDFDYRTGKLTKEDYDAERESLVQRGVAIIQHIDAQQSGLIEEAVRARRGVPGSTPELSSTRRPRRTRRTQKT